MEESSEIFPNQIKAEEEDDVLKSIQDEIPILKLKREYMDLLGLLFRVKLKRYLY